MGVGWYENGRPRVVKETRRADHSAKAESLAQEPPRSDLFVIHVRAATVGRIAYENTHPFMASAIGRPWIFAHNGTIRDLGRLSRGEFRQRGETDSERAFHYLLSRLENLDEAADEAEVTADILAGARELSRGGRVNFLLTDGRSLFAYHDGHRTLHFLERRADDPEDLGHLRVADDSDYTVDLDVADVPEERAVVVATVPLTDEPWTRMGVGEFLVCRDGRVLARTEERPN